MDRTIQLTLLSLAFLPTLAFGQCKEKTIDIETDTLGCKHVILSPDMWAYYYLADKNLQAIEDSIPKLSHQIEKERERADKVQALSESQIATAQSIIQVSEEGRQDCDQALVNIAVKNMQLKKKLARKNKTIKMAAVGGLIGGLLLNALIP